MTTFKIILAVFWISSFSEELILSCGKYGEISLKGSPLPKSEKIIENTFSISFDNIDIKSSSIKNMGGCLDGALKEHLIYNSEKYFFTCEDYSIACSIDNFCVKISEKWSHKIKSLKTDVCSIIIE